MRQRLQFGLTISLITLVVMTLTLLAALPTTTSMAQSVTNTYTPSVTPLITNTPTATTTGTPPPTATPLGCSAPLDLAVDDVIYVRGGVYLRGDSTVSSAIVHYVEQNTAFRVRGGPICTDGYNWWFVSSGVQTRGWVAEGRPDETGYFISASGLTAGEVPVTCGDSSGFTIGETILLYRSLRVRQEPGLSGLVLTVATNDTEAVVLEGPICQDNYNWWKVRLQVLDVVYDGWIAQGTQQSTQDWLESEAALSQEVCAPPVNLVIGEPAYVNATNNIPKRMRSYPGLSAPVVYDLIGNVPLIILDGPICKDGFNWWKVSVRSNVEAVGWMADGGGGSGRWIKPLPVEGIR